MRKILLSVILVLAMSACAFGDIVYSTEDGSLGVVRVYRQLSADVYGIQYNGKDDDTCLGSYWDGDNSRIILVSRTTDNTTSGDTALIFNPANMSKPTTTEPKVLTGVHNTQMITGTNNGRGLYFATSSSVREFNTETFKRVRGYISKPASGDTERPVVRSVAASSNTVYVMTEEESSGDVVLVFDGQLKESVDGFKRRQAHSGSEAMTCLSNGLLVVGHEDGVDGLRSSGFYRIVSTDESVRAICRDGDKGFYFVEQSEGGDASLKHYDKDGEVKELRSESVSGGYSLVYADSDGVMCAIWDGKLLVYSLSDNELVGEFGSSELGGEIRQVTSGTVKGESKDNSSGCNLSGLGMLLMTLLLRRRK